MGIGTFILISLIKILLAVFILLTAVAYTVLLERKVVAHMQNRWGPSRVGPFGIWQPLADGLKFIFKEDLTPPYVNKPLYLIAPIIAVTTALTSIAVIPIGPLDHRCRHSYSVADSRRQYRLADHPRDHVGGSLWRRVSGVVVQQQILDAGWLTRVGADGELRNRTGPVSDWRTHLCRQLRPARSNIVNSQSRILVWLHPQVEISFRGCRNCSLLFIYIMAAYAETNRIPFDLPEAETELVAGYHTEYSSMKFAMFFMAEYANMVTVACLASVLFLGGWSGPVFGPPIVQSLLPVLWFALRVFVFLFIYIWVRGTLPRFRYDQLMAFGWKFLLPLALANIVITSLVVALK